MVIPRQGFRIAARGAVALLAGCGAFPADWSRTDADGLDAYKASFHRAVGDRVATTLDRSELLARARAADVLWLGDHHRDVVLHDRWLRLIDDLADDVVPHRPVVLALECVGTADGPAIEAFLAGRLDLTELRARIRERWPESWLDGDQVDAAFYRDLLRLARERGLGVCPLEPTPRLPLPERDETMAATVRQLLTTDAARPLVIAVVGQAHLLGDGDLVGRVGHTAVAVVASAEGPLAARLTELAATGPGARFAVTERGILAPIPTR